MKRSKTVGEYIKELKENKKEKPAQIKEALEVYIELWQGAIENGIVSIQDSIDDALSKVESKGGLYQAASAQPTPPGD